MPLSIIAAVAESGVIGRDGTLPWHLSADLQRFKRLTMGHTMIMGRRTWESIARPLPGRRTIVVSRQTDYKTDFDEVLHAASLGQAHSLAQELEGAATEIFVIGGAGIYREALPLVDRLYLTRVQAHVDGDAYFPDYDKNDWRCVESDQHEADARNDHPYCFEVYRRKLN